MDDDLPLNNDFILYTSICSFYWLSLTENSQPTTRESGTTIDRVTLAMLSAC